MSKIGISLKLDVKKLDKARFFAAQSGALYVDLTMFLDPDKEGQYGDHGVITQSVSKEERDQGLQMPIAGNGKIFYGLQQLKGNGQQEAQQPAQGNYQQQPQQPAPQSYQQPAQQPAQQSYQQPQQPAQQHRPAPQPAPAMDQFDDDIPFN